MRTTWVRRKPRRSESAVATLAAVGAAVAVGAVTWYLTRTVLARDELSLQPSGSLKGIGDGTPKQALASESESERPG